MAKKIKGKLLAAAIALLGLSTAGAVTGTVAWFTAANTVSISGMQIQAEVEEGIVISNEAKAVWKTEADASHDGSISDTQQKFIPTSTADGSTWYHAYSKNVNDATDYTDAGHEALTLTSPVANGIGVVNDAESPVNGKNIFLLNKFYIQSSSSQAIDDQDIYVKDFSITGGTAALSPSLRVLVKYTTTSNGTSALKIFEPISGADDTYGVNGGANLALESASGPLVTYSNLAGNHKVADTVDIPAYTAGGTSALEFEVYVYFEGEDASCKSANAAGIENLEVGFSFFNQSH